MAWVLKNGNIRHVLNNEPPIANPEVTLTDAEADQDFIGSMRDTLSLDDWHEPLKHHVFVEGLEVAVLQHIIRGVEAIFGLFPIVADECDVEHP